MDTTRSSPDDKWPGSEADMVKNKKVQLSLCRPVKALKVAGG